MSNNAAPGAQRTWRWWARVWWPVLLGVVVITIESTMLFGADHTSGPLRKAFEFIFGHVADERWAVVHHLVRKTGHFVGYGLIGLAWLRAWWLTLPLIRFNMAALLALAGTALIASCDEWHQAYLPNRTGTPVDVLLDSSGALILILLVYLYVRMLHADRLVRTS